jgi:hypothetical protein
MKRAAAGSMETRWQLCFGSAQFAATMLEHRCAYIGVIKRCPWTLHITKLFLEHLTI